jgi:hypothetical protein
MSPEAFLRVYPSIADFIQNDVLMENVIIPELRQNPKFIIADDPEVV